MQLNMFKFDTCIMRLRFIVRDNVSDKIEFLVGSQIYSVLEFEIGVYQFVYNNVILVYEGFFKIFSIQCRKVYIGKN